MIKLSSDIYIYFALEKETGKIVIFKKHAENTAQSTHTRYSNHLENKVTVISRCLKINIDLSDIEDCQIPDNATAKNT